MKNNLNNISVIGAGAWGTALAQVFAGAGRAVTLYTRTASLAETIRRTRENDTYLSGIQLHEKIKAEANLTASVAGADIVVLVTPTQFVRTALEQLKPHLPQKVLLVNAAKGIEIATGKLLSGVTEEVAPGHPYAVLSGPTFAHEVARGLPTAVTLATTAPLEQAQRWAEALSGKTFRPYISSDPVGAEIAGAIKNVIAIACGIVEGKGLGQNARAAVMTRGVAEMKRFGLAKGARAETFLGLSGLGDLTLTCHSMASRNFSLGFELGQGRSLEEVMASRRTVAEGVTTAEAVASAALALSIDMPICDAVNKILHHAAVVDDIVKELLSRHLRFESD